MQYRTERKRSAVRGVQTWGELANGSEAHIRRTGGRIGDGVKGQEVDEEFWALRELAMKQRWRSMEI